VHSQTLYKLVASAYLKPSTALSHVSPRDNQIKYEAEERAKISGFPTAKELRHAKETAEARLKQEEAEAEKIGLVSESNYPAAMLVRIIQHYRNTEQVSGPDTVLRR
jgi:DNA-directed RNA polymerase III subunit RPC3